MDPHITSLVQIFEVIELLYSKKKKKKYLIIVT